ncbi:hypothetical protein RJ639_018446 [Escallonia herrerae]|uniref:CBM-cenC domain-containing protein n=1 Tax=Escallonia herrerae TaxID=1293975 RepID=A0AA89AID8_9ASTE|nr:hypothetical protein RJ639_018446 [Escallonia herrerae]
MLVDKIVVYKRGHTISSSVEQSVPFEDNAQSLSTHKIEDPGNIIQNHDFSWGVQEPWKLMHKKYVFVHRSGYRGIYTAKGESTHFAWIEDRTEYWQGLEQEITSRITPNTIYALSACVRVLNNVQAFTRVTATLRLEFPRKDYISIGRTLVEGQHWEDIQGFTFCLPRKHGQVFFYLAGLPPEADLLIASVTLKEVKRCILSEDTNIIQNPDFMENGKGWASTMCRTEIFSSLGYARTTNRLDSSSGIQQDVSARVQTGLVYEINVEVRVSGDSEAEVHATLRLRRTDLRKREGIIARAPATDEKWVKLQGKFFLLYAPLTATIRLDGSPPGTDIFVKGLRVSGHQPPADLDLQFENLQKVIPMPVLHPRHAPSLGQLPDPPAIINPPRHRNWRESKCIQILVDKIVVYKKGHTISSAVEQSVSLVENAQSLSTPKIQEDPGNIIQNHDFSWGVQEPWKLMHKKYLFVHKSGYRGIYTAKGESTHFAWIEDRTQYWQGLEQEITSRITPNTIYALSACVRVLNNVQAFTTVTATLRTLVGGQQWEDIKGFTFCLPRKHGQVYFYLGGPPPEADLLIDSVTLKENPDFIEDGKGWASTMCRVEIISSLGYARATNRVDSSSGIEQDIIARVQTGLVYEINVEVRVSGVNEADDFGYGQALLIQTSCGNRVAHKLASSSFSRVQSNVRAPATDEKWVKLQGKFFLPYAPLTATIRLDGSPPGTDIFVKGLRVSGHQPPADLDLQTASSYGIIVMD